MPSYSYNQYGQDQGGQSPSSGQYQQPGGYQQGGQYSPSQAQYGQYGQYGGQYTQSGGQDNNKDEPDNDDDGPVKDDGNPNTKSNGRDNGPDDADGKDNDNDLLNNDDDGKDNDNDGKDNDNDGLNNDEDDKDNDDEGKNNDDTGPGQDDDGPGKDDGNPNTKSNGQDNGPDDDADDMPDDFLKKLDQYSHLPPGIPNPICEIDQICMKKDRPSEGIDSKKDPRMYIACKDPADNSLFCPWDNCYISKPMVTCMAPQGEPQGRRRLLSVDGDQITMRRLLADDTNGAGAGLIRSGINISIFALLFGALFNGKGVVLQAALIAGLLSLLMLMFTGN